MHCQERSASLCIKGRQEEIKSVRLFNISCLVTRSWTIHHLNFELMFHMQQCVNINQNIDHKVRRGIGDKIEHKLILN